MSKAKKVAAKESSPIASLTLTTRPIGTPPMPIPNFGAETRGHVSRSVSRRLLLSMSAGLLVGTLIPVAFLIPLFPTGSPQAAEIPSIRVSVSSDAQKILTTTVHLPTQTAPAAAVATQEKSDTSNVMSFVAQQAPSIEPREFLYVKNDYRIFQPEMSLEVGQFKRDETMVSASDLKLIPDSGGRFKSAKNEIEWQGGWNFADPEHNLKLAADYQHYVDGDLGSLQTEFSTVGAERSKILNKLAKVEVGPTGLSR